MAKRTIADLNIKLSAGSATLRQDLQQATGQVNSFASQITSVGTKIAGAFAGLFAVSKITSAFSGAMQSVDALGETADKIGVTTEALQSVQMAAELAGVGMADLETGGRKFQKQISEAAAGTKTAVDTFSELGVSIQQLRGLPFNEQLAIVTDALRNVSDQTDRTRLAMDLFGRSGDAFAMLDGQQIRQAAADIEALGTGISRMDAAKVEEANDAITRMKAALGNLVNEAAIAVAPALTMAAESVATFAAWLNNLDPITVGNTVRLVAFVAGFAAVLVIIPRIVSAVRTVIVTLRALATAQAITSAMAGPAGWIKLAAAAGIAAASVGTVSAAFDKVEASASQAAQKSRAAVKGPRVDFVEDIEDEGAKAAAEQAQQAREQALKQMEDFQRRAKDLTTENESPFEKYQADMKELQALFAQRLISPETHDRAGKKYRQELEQALSVQERIGEAQRTGPQNVGAMEKGSTQALSAIQSGAKEWREVVQAQKAVERAQKETNKLLGEIVKKTGEPMVIEEAKL